MIVLVSALDAGWPKRKVWVRSESFCSREFIILFILLKKVFQPSANKGHGLKFFNKKARAR